MAGVKPRFFPRTMRRGKARLRLSFFLGATWLTTLLTAYAGSCSAAERPPFRLACSASMFSEVNESDARAAMNVWILTVAKEKNISVDPDPHIHRSVEDMIQFGLKNAVNGFCLTTPEIPRLSREIKLDLIAVGSRNGSITEEYLLLVRKDSGLNRLDQLRGRSINILDNPRMSLALIWLDTLLLESHLDRATDFFGHVNLKTKAPQVALPVFFGKTEACLMTRTSFEVMGELNPQLNLQMRVLATSPGVVPTGFAFRTDHASPVSKEILQAMEHLGDTPAGRQILSLTKSDRIEARPLSCLDGSLKLLAKHRRLCKENLPGMANKTRGEKQAGVR